MKIREDIAITLKPLINNGDTVMRDGGVYLYTVIASYPNGRFSNIVGNSYFCIREDNTQAYILHEKDLIKVEI